MTTTRAPIQGVFDQGSGNLVGVAVTGGPEISLYSVPTVTTGLVSAATANTAAINAALAKGGVVSISSPGVVYINDTLVGGRTPTQLRIDAGVIVRCVPKVAGGAAFPAVRNHAFQAPRYAITGISGVLVGTHSIRITVTMPGHSLKADEFLYILQDTSGNFNGFWPIESVTANTVVILTGSANPTSGFTFPQPTGSPLGQRGDVDFTVTGPGTIDMNFLDGGFTEAGDWRDHGIVMNNVLRPTVENMRVMDARKYCVCMQNFWHMRVRNLEGRTIADGVHCYGPFEDAQVDGVFGEFGDDSVIFQTVDGTGYVQYHLPEVGRAYPGGSFSNTRFANVAPRWSGNAGSVMVYTSGGIDMTGGSAAGYTWPAGDLGYKATGQHIGDGAHHGYQSNSSGYYSSSTFTIGGGYVLTTGSIDHLHLRNIQFGPLAFDNTGGGVIKIKNLTLDNPSTDTAVGTGNSRIVFAQVAVDNFIVNGGYIKNQSGTANDFILLKGSGAVVKNLVFNGTWIEAGTGQSNFVAGNGGTLNHVTFNSVYAVGTVALISDSAGVFANRVAVTVNGAVQDAGSASALIAYGGTVAMDLYLNGIHIITGRMLNLYGTGASNVVVSNFRDDGGSGTSVLNWPTGNVASFTNPDGTMPVNIQQIKRAAGSMAKAYTNTGSGSASDILATNMAICDATNTTGSWKQISAPTTRSY